MRPKKRCPRGWQKTRYNFNKIETKMRSSFAGQRRLFWTCRAVRSWWKRLSCCLTSSKSPGFFFCKRVEYGESYLCISSSVHMHRGGFTMASVDSSCSSCINKASWRQRPQRHPRPVRLMIVVSIVTLDVDSNCGPSRLARTEGPHC